MSLKLCLTAVFSKNVYTNLTEYIGMNSSAPEETLLTTGVNPHASFVFTIIPSTPMNMAERRMLPKFYGSVMPSRKRYI